MFLIVSKLYAQGVSPSFVTLNLGLSAPVGKYASTNYKSTQAGFANPGAVFGVEMAIFVNKHFGIGGTANLAVNLFNKQAFESAIATNNDNLSNVSVTKAPPYLNLYSATGFYFNFDVSDKFALMPKILGGLLITKIPEVELVAQGTADNDNYKTYNYAAIAVKPTPVFGLNIVYKVREEALFKVNLDWVAASQHFTEGGNNFVRKINMFNIMASAGVAF